jgi:hypothetical protein
MPITSRTRKTLATRPVARRAPRRGASGGGKGSNTWMWWAGGIALSIVISLVLKLSHKANDDTEVRGEMIQVVHGFPDYADNSAYYGELVDRYHHDAFDAAYSMGGRRSSASIDAKAYLIQISARMATKAAADGKKSVAETLTRFNTLLRTK